MDKKKSLPVLHHNAVYIFIFLGIIDFILISENRVSLKPMLVGGGVCVCVCVWGGGGGGGGVAYAAFQTKLLHMQMKRLNDAEISIVITLWYNVRDFQGQRLQILFDLAAVGVKCRMAAVKSLPILHRSAVYIIISLGIIEPIMISGKSSSA